MRLSTTLVCAAIVAAFGTVSHSFGGRRKYTVTSSHHTFKRGMNMTGKRPLLILSAAVIFLAFASQSKAAMIGPDVIDRSTGSDGTVNIMQIYTSYPMPSAGSVTDFSFYKKDKDSGGNLHFLLLRPTSGGGYPNASTYQVLYVSGPVNTDSLAFGAAHTISVGSPVAVQAGDIFAHFGWGIPYVVTAPGDRAVYRDPVASNTISAPLVGDTLTIKLTGDGTWSHNDYNWGGQNRIYSLAVNFVEGQINEVPEPATLSLALVGGLFGLAFVVVRRRRKIA